MPQVRVDGVPKLGAVTETIQVSATAATLRTDAPVRAETTGKNLEKVLLPPGRNYLQALRTL